MKFREFCEPRCGMSVRQLLQDKMFAYDLHLCHLRHYWKGLPEENNIKNGIQNEFGSNVP